MMFIGQGDDALIKHQVGIIFVLLFVLIALIAAFGLVIVGPNGKQDFSYTYRYHPIVSNRYIQIDEPLLPRQCHG